jgi:hypothetical protein
MAIQYKIAGGEPTAKWKASAKAGAGVGLPLAIVLGYFVARIDPTIPTEVREMLVGLIVWALTQGAMMLAGYRQRPSPRDRPVVDQAASKRPVEPLP